MYRKKKAGNDLGIEKLRNCFMRMLRSESTQASSHSEKNASPDLNGTVAKEVSDAMLEAELRKSHAIMERERHPFVF